MFKGLHRIIAGGLISAMGILIMHYMGMWAQRTQVSLKMDANTIFISSICIAVAAASTAFWILFRLLTFWPMEWIRVAGALIMSVAVCGTHYTGMFAAKYSYDPTLHVDTAGLFNAEMAGTIASHCSLIVCYLLCSWGVVAKIDRSARKEGSGSITSSMGSERSKRTVKRPFSVVPLIKAESVIANN